MDTMAHLDTDLLKPTEIAHRLGVSRSWVYDAAKAGRIPCVRLGSPDGPLRFLPDDIEAWLERARRRWLPGESATRATSRAARNTPVRTAQLRIDAFADDP
jgi:excisionase family DNA binding protein